MPIAPARTKVAVGTATTSLTATFDEGTAVGTDHLLVASVMWTSSTDTATSNWTSPNVFSAGSNGSTNQHAWISVRGNGSTNSITVTFSATETYAKIVLFAIPGYSSIVPTTVLQTTASGTTATSPALGSTTDAFIGVSLALGAGSGGGWVSGWTNGYTNTTDVASDRFSVGWLGQTGTATPAQSARTWTTARVSRLASVSYPIVAAGADVTAPSVAITAPTDGGSVSGTTSVTGTTSDDTAVTSVQVLVDGVLQGTATIVGGNWSYSLDSTAFEDGDYTLRATAFDAAGNNASSAITVTIDNAVGATGDVWMAGSTPASRAYLGTMLVYGTPYSPPGAGEVASFGPNGTHWPERTPLPTDTMDFQVTAASATWGAISTAITTALASTPTNGNGVVWIPNGVLTGNGAGATSTPVLQNLGSTGRGKRILVYPQNGWGNVTTSNSLRFFNLKGIVIGGIDMGAESYGLNISACEDFATVRMRGIAFNVTGETSMNTKNIQLVEMVTPTALLRDQDRWGWRTTSTGVGPISDISAIGCYIAPAYRNVGSDSHCDSWQLSGQNGNTYGNILYKDCTVFASTNHAVQIGGGYGLTFQHMLIFGGTVTKRKFPVPSGGDTVPNGHAIGGGGQPNGCSVFDSTIIGNLSGPSFQEVQNSKTDDSNYNSIFAPMVGGWTYDTSLSAWTSTEIDAAAAVPDSARLATIWA